MKRLVEIRNRFTGEVIASGKTLIEAVECYKDDLCGASLFCGSFRGAHLRRASFRDANVRYADFGGAELPGADFRGAGIYYANFKGAYLRDANFRGAKLNWQSHDLMAEILRQAAGDDIDKIKIAGLVLLCRDKCWDEFLMIDDPLMDWALDALAEYVQEGDDAPKYVRNRKAKK